MRTLLILSFAIPFCLSAVTPRHYIDHLRHLHDYRGHVTYSVLLPQAEDPVTYDITLNSTVAEGDTLAPCRYLIEWQPERAELGSGFAAYLDGGHYRYRGNRLQEYHMSWDSIPFIVGNGGVQCNAQFVDVLPQFMGRDLDRLVADSNFVYTFTPDTLYNGRTVAVIEGKIMYDGYVSKESTYIFDPVTLMPVAVEMENNPGSISEQSVTICYNGNGSSPFPVNGEDSLIAMYPEVFEKYRESNFRVENLPGTQLPTFTSPMSGSDERFVYHRGDPLDNPAVILVVDDSGANTAAAIEDTRRAADMSPAQFDIIIAFVGVDPELAADKTGRLRDGEVLLTQAKSLARDCGVTSYPTFLYVGRDGRVEDVTLGYNKNLVELVIQTSTLHFR